MVKNPKFLKNLLTTASVVALASFAGNAIATERDTTVNGNNNIAGGAQNDLTAVFADGVDTIKLIDANADLTTVGPIDMSGGAVNINAKAGRTFNVNHPVIYGGGVDLAMKLIVGAGGTITLQDQTGVGNDTTVNGGTVVMRVTGHDLIVTAGTATSSQLVTRDLNVSGGIANVVDVGRNVIQTGGTINQTAAIVGTLNVSGAGSIFAGAAGATDAAGVTLQANLGNGTVTLRNSTDNVAVAGGTLNIVAVTGGGHNVVQTGGRINQTGAIAGSLDVSGAGSIFAGAAGATDVGGTVILNANLGVGTVTIRDAAGNVTVGGGTLVMRNITGGGATMAVTGGTVTANDLAQNLTNTVGNVTITGTVTGTSGLNGAGTTKITGDATGLVTVAGGHTTEVGGDLTNGATFTSDEKITLKGDANHSVGAVIAANIGSIVADEALAGKTLRFTGLVGGAGNSLKLIQAKGGSAVKLDGISYIKKIDLGTQDTTLQLSGTNYKIEELAHSNDTTTLLVDNAATKLLAGTVVSAADNRLKAVKLNGAKTLTLEDGVNLYTTNSGAVDTGITSTADGAGRLAFEGESTVDAVFTRSIGRITSAGAGKTVKFTKDVKLSAAAGDSGIITIGNRSIMEFNGGIAAAALQGAGAGQGTAVFRNTADATITLTGAGTGLLAVKVAGSNLNFGNVLPEATTYEFGAQAVNISATGDQDLTGATLTTESTARNQNFKITNGNLILDKVGAADKHFGTFSVDANKLITVNNVDFFASVGGAGANATFNAANGKVDNIGGENAAMKVVKFDNDTEVSGNVYAETLTVKAGQKGTFNGIVAGGKVVLDNGLAPGAATTATFKDGSTLVSTVVGTITDKAVVNFDGGTKVQNGLGTDTIRHAAINFNDATGKTQELAGDFYGTTTAFLKTVAQATGATTFHGKLDATSTTFDLGTEGIKLTDGVAVTPTVLKGDIVIKTTSDGTDNGMLIVDGKDTKVDLAGLTTLKLGLKDTTTARGVDGKVIQIITLTGGATLTNNILNRNANLDVADISDNSGNKFVRWTLDKTNLLFTSEDISVQVSKDILTKTGATEAAKQNNEKFADAPAGTAAADYYNELLTVGNLDEKSFKDSQDRISSPTARSASSAITAALAQTVSSTTTARMQTLANPAAIRVTQADGVSAGAEDTLRYGAWGSPFYSQGVQKMRKGVSGYKSKTVGGTVGFDTMANDTMIVGVAATIAKTDLKHKDINAGDKTKADTLMFSIYGLQEINDDWFLQGVANFGSTKVKNTSKRIGADIANNTVSNSTATGKYDSMSWGGELLGGYNLNVTSMAVITPMLGLDYTRTNDGGFTETGTRNQNLSVSKKSVDKTQLVAGVRAVMADIEQSGFVVTPEVHGFVRQALGSKNPKLTVKLDGAGELDTSNNAKLAKTTGNLGLGINASSGMMSYGLTYDAHMANKYVGHQGTFKVRVNF